jgi:uncharacterized protein
MLKTLKSFFLITIGLVFSFTALTITVSADESITIGTGGVTGVYYTTGGAICRLVNKEKATHGIRCSNKSTGGSVYNLNSIKEGNFNYGIAQSDWLYHAYNGSNKFMSVGPNKNLRAIFSVHMEPFTVIARAHSGIEVLMDLKGKRINIGNPGSGQRGTMEIVMDALGWTKSDFASVSELTSDEQAKALCEDKVDAIVFSVGHPSGSIKKATTSCESILVSLDNPVIDRLIYENSYYTSVVIPGGMYRGNPNDTGTFGVGATFVTSKNTSTETVYEIVKTVFSNFNTFKKFHPAFRVLKKNEMIKARLTVPLHDGALEYYKEIGLLK